MAIPTCKRCGAAMVQPGRYVDWRCSCCDESARCPHVAFWTRILRRLAGRRV